MNESNPTTSIKALIIQDEARRGDGAFGFSAMFRSGAYLPHDREMVAAKFEALGIEIERLRMRLAKIAHAPVPEDNKIALTLKQWAMSRDGENNG